MNRFLLLLTSIAILTLGCAATIGVLSYRLVASIPGAVLKSYPHAGYNVQWEKPKEVADDIRGFLTKMSAH